MDAQTDMYLDDPEILRAFDRARDFAGAAEAACSDVHEILSNLIDHQDELTQASIVTYVRNLDELLVVATDSVRTMRAALTEYLVGGN